jgi:hypothetical protein
MRAAATVVRLMPSPRKMITFFARPCIAPRAAACDAPSRNHHAAVSPPGWAIAGTATAMPAAGVDSACVDARWVEALAQAVRANTQANGSQGRRRGNGVIRRL